jgi:hypothetical protein
MRPFIRNLLQSAGVRSFFDDDTLFENSTREGHTETVEISPQVLDPEGQTSMIQATLPLEITMPEEHIETQSEKRRRRRREKVVRQKERKRRLSLAEQAGGADGEDEGVDEGVPIIGHTLVLENVILADVEDDLGSESPVDVDVEAERQQQTEEVGPDGEASHVVQHDSEALHVAAQVVEEDYGNVGEANTTEPQRLLDPTSDNEVARNEREPTILKPRVEQADNLHDAPSQRSVTSPTDQTPTTSQMPPKFGLGPSIEMPCPSEHRFIIDSLDPPTTQRCAIEMTCPEFPGSLAKLQDADLADSFRAGHMAASAHGVLADRLWRAVIFANYFSDSTPAEIDLPRDFQSMTYGQQRFGVLVQESKLICGSRPLPSHQAEVENAVLDFLRRAKQDSAELVDDCTRANKSMALRLHSSLMEGRVVTRKELYEMFIDSYGGEHERAARSWTVEGTGLEALFDDGSAI